MKKYFTFIFAFLIVGLISFTQEWQQTATTPEGAGITEIVVLPESNDIFVTTASFDWPNGEDGGVRRSINDGDTWENLFNAYSGRTIAFGADGNLYASVWPYPQNEGLYRSPDNGETWQQLVTVPSGNNIFSIAVSISTSPYSIFAGTRQGVYRSIDNGNTWAYSSSGIPADSWVRDIEVDPEGIVVAATTNGLFSSEDNGQSWQQSIGGGIEDKVVTKIGFDFPSDGKENTRLIGGSEDGNLYEAFRESKYLTTTLLAIFDNSEVSGIWTAYLQSENNKMHGISTFPQGTQPGGFTMSTDNGASWQKNNFGLPSPSVPSSALSGNSNDTQIKLKLGLFQNMNGGAKVYKISYDWATILEVDDHDLNLQSVSRLDQNYPNPFDKTTTIEYFKKETSHTSLKVYTVSGKLIITLVDTWQLKGEHQLSFNAEVLKQGIYYYILESAGITDVRKMIILK